jgi:hypothetical protein
MANTIKCPKCGHEFPASEGLISHLKEEAGAEIEKKIRSEIESEKSLELSDLKKTLEEREKKINEFREQELELREKSRKLEEKEKDLELETQRRMDAEKSRVEEETSKRLGEEYRLKELENEKRVSDMKKMIEDLKRTSQQGSMQTQGEVAELDLEETLRRLFPTDEISEVKKGELGGDVRQVVKTQRGTDCGLIVWERKRTKAWTEDWVKKLKEDIARDKANLGVIVTEVLPKDFKKEIGEKSGIWITTAPFVEPLAMLLRKVLYDVAKEKSVKAGKQSQAEEIYDFVTSSEFISQIENMVTIYQEMKGEISKERAVYERQWKLREVQVDSLLKGLSGVYGSMQGYAKNALPQVKSLELMDGKNN